MKKRIVCLLTAMIMMTTIFAVPMTSVANSTATDETVATEETTATDNSNTTETEATEETTQSTDPAEPEAPAEPEDPAEPEEPAAPVDLVQAQVTIPQKNYQFTKAEVKPQVTVTVDGVTLKPVDDYVVQYSNNIYPGTATITITGKGNYTGTATKTFGIGTPTGLIWKSSKTNSIKMDWNSMKNIDGYQVYRYNFSKAKWVFVKKVTASDTTVKNLIPGTGYKFKVRSYYNTGSKTYYSPFSAVNSMPTKPNQVNITKLVNHPALYVKLTWGKRNSSGYQVMLARNATFTKKAKTFKANSPTKLTKKITSLKNNQQYYIKVRAYKTYGNKTTYGAWSKSKAFSTNGTRWYNANGKKYYYKEGKLVKGKMMFGKHQYFFNYEDGAWSGASSKMWEKVKNSSSKTKYLIAVSRELNRICVYQGSKGDWKLKSYWMCSTGAPEGGSISKTPTGSWLMPEEDNHIGYIGGHKDYTCWYATRFYKRCFFHSVLYQPASKTQIQDGRLGMNISDGCIRMNIDDAKWIYDNCHTGTRVIVY